MRNALSCVFVAPPGWGTAEMLGTKVIPLWVGARGVEFQWFNLQAALDANTNLVQNYVMWSMLVSHVNCVSAVSDGDLYAVVAVEQERFEQSSGSILSFTSSISLLSFCPAKDYAVLLWI